MDLERFNTILRIRVFGSAIVYAVFVAVALHGVLTGWHFDNPTPAVALLLISFFGWPRRATPRDWNPDPESEMDRKREIAGKILKKRLNRVRLFYFLAAVFLLVVLPFLLGDYDFQFAAWV